MSEILITCNVNKITFYSEKTILLNSKNLVKYRSENNFAWTIKIIM